jgi:hypothetical protein
MKISYNRKEIIDILNEGSITWEQIISGFETKADEGFYSKNNKIYDLHELYPKIAKNPSVFNILKENGSLVDYVDTAEEESALIAVTPDDLKKNKYYTHMEIDASLILGVMGNQIIYPENNPVTRNSFSCGQSKQAVSVYHSNHQMRIDKMGVILNYGQIPLVKSRYMEYINKEEQPYGVNAIVAIMSYTGYNVEDAILINEGSIHRGIFRTTYLSMYEAREESSKITGSGGSKFANIEKNNVIRKKPDYDYSQLDDYGMIKENTELNDKMILIGKINYNTENKDTWIDDSVKPKKGQLGFVDKAFITLGEEGFNIAKVRVREERIPAIGDKMASRAGQKGTLGLIIPEDDMPFTHDGIRPDLIINPHAIPSRMTIGQIVESLFGKVCTSYGAFGDCTAFQVKGSNYSTYAPLLVKAGFNSTGNQIMYNGMTGEQLISDIYIGPTYYMRLKHMVKDKINYRARGPNTVLTRQPVQGRANDGGLRIGEMERDGVLAHGMSYFLNESFMVRGEKSDFYIAVCNKTGSIAIYNEAKNLFLSPFADGPINFTMNPDGSQSIKNLSRFGRSFSVLKVPYSLKLLIQELQIMNIQMRIITEDNIDQLLSMSYSNNINKLLQLPDNNDLKQTINQYLVNITRKLNREVVAKQPPQEEPQLPEPVKIETETLQLAEPVELPIQMNISSSEIPYPNVSPAYSPSNSSENAASPAYIPNTEINDTTPDYYKRTQLENGIVQVEPKYNFPEDLGYYFMNLSNSQKTEVLNKPYEEQINYLKEIRKKKENEYGWEQKFDSNKGSILEVENVEEKTEPAKESQTSSSEEKKVIIQEESSQANKTSESSKKIIL